MKPDKSLERKPRTLTSFGQEKPFCNVLSRTVLLPCARHRRDAKESFLNGGPWLRKGYDNGDDIVRVR